MEEVATEDEIREFVGDGAEYYLEKWSGLLKSERGRAGFNWTAFFLSVPWVVYRKMYGIAAIFIALIVAEIVLEYIYFVGHLEMPEPPGYLDPFVAIAVGAVCGRFGNRWYFAHAQKVINDVRLKEPELEARKTALTKRGGTSWLGVLLVIIMTFSGALLSL